MNNSREKQLAKNTIIVAIGKICTQFVSFFLLPLYTALLSAEEYGVVDLLNTYIALLIPIFFLQLDQAVFRFLIDIRKDELKKKKIISSATFTLIKQIIIYLIVFGIFSMFIDNNYKVFLATNVIASMLSNYLLQLSRGLGDNKTYSVGSLISGAGTVILNVIFIAIFKWGANGMLCATLIANLMCASYVFLKKTLYKYIDIKEYDKKENKELLKYSIPLIPNQLSWWIVSASDRVIISNILDLSQNGIYSAANKFSSICVSLFNIFNMTWSESASLHIKDDDSSNFFSNILNTTLKLFTALGLGIIAFMPFVFKFLITGNEYADAYYQIPILMISTIFSITVSLFGSIYVALKKSNEIAKTSIYAAIINIIVNIVLIKSIGLYAASISTLLAYFSMVVYRYIDIQKYVKIKLDKRMLIASLIVGSIIIAFYYSKNKCICLLGALISIIYALVFNIKIVKNILRILKEKVSNKF